jgi:hypothetical protein
MSENLGPKEKKQVVKDIILKLHKGLSVEEARDKFEREVGSITSMEIAEIEQSLMNEGISPDEIKKFCNVHALLFESALGKAAAKEESPAHPVYLSKLENREIEKITQGIKEWIKKRESIGLAPFKQKLNELLAKLKNIDTHYTWKEQVLFPYLEKYGFLGPSKVMWGKDDEIRELLSRCILRMERVKAKKELDEYLEKNLNLLLAEVDGMISKEEKILFPTSLEKLNVQDWVEVLKETENVGYGFIAKPKETSSLIEELKGAVIEEPIAKEEAISFPTGELQLKELMGIFKTLPVDITFIDKEDTVRFFSEGPHRIFLRTKSIIGRKVQNCHPPKSVHVVESILKSFKEGKRDAVDFWIHYQGRFVYIRYFAIRDKDGNYLGTLEVTQDATEIKGLSGEKRLLDGGK